jgi:hypothetical protein
MDRAVRIRNYGLQRHDHESSTMYSDAAARSLLPSLNSSPCDDHRITNKAASCAFTRSSIERLSSIENGTWVANLSDPWYIIACSLFHDHIPAS